VIELRKFHLYPVSVSKLIGLTQPNVGGDLYDIPRVMPGASFVLICAQQERPAVKNPAWNDAHRHAPAIFIRFEAYDVRRREYGEDSSTWRVPGYNSHAGFLLIETAQAFDPESEIGSSADHLTSKGKTYPQ